jgi:predicted tellurium resistance membrane protein TerC
VITAVGMVPHREIMVVAVVLSVIVMLVFAAPVGDFVEEHPSIEMLNMRYRARQENA